MKTITNWEDRSLILEGVRRQRAAAKRETEIDVLLRHHIARLHTALADDFQLSDAEIRELVLSYYCAKPAVRG